MARLWRVRMAAFAAEDAADLLLSKMHQAATFVQTKWRGMVARRTRRDAVRLALQQKYAAVYKRRVRVGDNWRALRSRLRAMRVLRLNDQVRARYFGGPEWSMARIVGIEVPAEYDQQPPVQRERYLTFRLVYEDGGVELYAKRNWIELVHRPKFGGDDDTAVVTVPDPPKNMRVKLQEFLATRRERRRETRRAKQLKSMLMDLPTDRGTCRCCVHACNACYGLTCGGDPCPLQLGSPTFASLWVKPTTFTLRSARLGALD